jgi:hypothetical protein
MALTLTLILHIKGLYGPVTRHDLFIGAKVKIFGRTLAVTSASRTGIYLFFVYIYIHAYSYIFMYVYIYTYL